VPGVCVRASSRLVRPAGMPAGPHLHLYTLHASRPLTGSRSLRRTPHPHAIYGPCATPAVAAALGVGSQVGAGARRERSPATHSPPQVVARVPLVDGSPPPQAAPLPRGSRLAHIPPRPRPSTLSSVLQSASCARLTLLCDDLCYWRGVCSYVMLCYVMLCVVLCWLRAGAHDATLGAARIVLGWCGIKSKI